MERKEFFKKIMPIPREGQPGEVVTGISNDKKATEANETKAAQTEKPQGEIVPETDKDDTNNDKPQDQENEPGIKELERIQSIDDQIHSFLYGINHGKEKDAKQIQEQIEIADSILLELESNEDPKIMRLVKSFQNRKERLLEKLNEQIEKEDKTNIEVVKESIATGEKEQSSDDTEKVGKTAENTTEAGQENQEEAVLGNIIEECRKRKEENIVGIMELQSSNDDKIKKLESENQKEALASEEEKELQRLYRKKERLAGLNVSVGMEKELNTVLLSREKKGPMSLEESVAVLNIIRGLEKGLNMAKNSFNEEIGKATEKQRMAVNNLADEETSAVTGETEKFQEPVTEATEKQRSAVTNLVNEKASEVTGETEEFQEPATAKEIEDNEFKKIRITREELKALLGEDLDNEIAIQTIVTIAREMGENINANEIQNKTKGEANILVEVNDGKKFIIDLRNVDKRYKKEILKERGSIIRQLISDDKFTIKAGMIQEREEEATEISEDTDTKKEIIGMAFGRPIFRQEEKEGSGIGSRITEAGKKLHGGISDKQTPANEKEMIGKISENNARKIVNNFLTPDISKRLSAVWMKKYNISQYSEGNKVEKSLEIMAKENNGEGRNRQLSEFIEEAFKNKETNGKNSEVPFVIARFEELADKPASDFTVGDVLDIIKAVSHKEEQ